jgi:hypothetical protein
MLIRSCSSLAEPHDATVSGETTIPPTSKRRTNQNIMGDKSPKATAKKSTQKATKATSAKKAPVAAAKPAAKKK